MSSTPRPLSGLLYSGGKLLRAGGRSATELRPVEIIPHFISSAEGSALIRLGEHGGRSLVNAPVGGTGDAGTAKRRITARVKYTALRAAGHRDTG